MTAIAPFCPQYGSNQVVTPAAASANAAITKNCKQVRVVNTGANIGYFRTYFSGDNAAGFNVATTADCPVDAGGEIIVTKSEAHDRIAFISAAGTTFQVMTGEGWN